jgi:hypothetical protein
MVSSNRMLSDARAIAEEALFESGETPRGARLEMATERVAEILLQASWRTKTQQDYARWRQCVHRAAVLMAKNGERRGGARLERMAGMQFQG